MNPDIERMAKEAGPNVRIQGHQYYAEGTLEAVGITQTGPMAVCWVGDQLKTFDLNPSTKDCATYWIDRVCIEPEPVSPPPQSSDKAK